MKIESGLDEAQLEVLRCIVEKIASAKNNNFTGTLNFEMHVSQGSVGDVYSWSKEKIRNTRKRRVRSRGI